ncbi:MAG: peptide ABC transporter substrate-binding protein [Vulcanimicrobiaceae bacterium]
MKRLLALAALGAVITGCTQVNNGAATGGRHPWTKPGYLRIAIQQDVKNLNPLLNSNTTDAMIARLMFAPLTAANERNELIPVLATAVPTLDNGGITKDGLTITYHLRKDAKWTDGVPVTSKDVKWSWQAIMNPDNNIVSRHGYDFVKSIDTPDDYTVICHLKQKFSPFVDTFFTDSDQPFPVAPAHVLSKYPNINQIQFNNEPLVNDGPFKFVKWVHGDHIDLVANPDFFMGKPKLSRITLKVIQDENTSVNELRTHDIDWIFQASIHNYPNIKNIPNVNLNFVAINGYEDVQLNTARPYLKDVLVRQAIAYAIDKQAIMNTLTFGTQQIATEDQPPFMWAYNPNIKPLPRDLDKAKQLLEQAGWRPGPDGIMQKNGEKLDLVLVSNNSNVTRRQMSVQLQAMLRQAGIQTEVKFYPGDVLFAPAGEGGVLQGGKFDLSLAGWYAGVDPDDSSQFMCKNIPPGGYNYPRYCSSAMDSVQQEALTTYDRPTRKKAYFRIQELLANDVPEVFFYYYRQLEPANDDFKGFTPSPVIEDWNAWQWSI